jgi:hypothetical protein
MATRLYKMSLIKVTGNQCAITNYSSTSGINTASIPDNQTTVYVPKDSLTVRVYDRNPDFIYNDPNKRTRVVAVTSKYTKIDYVVVDEDTLDPNSTSYNINMNTYAATLANLLIT